MTLPVRIGIEARSDRLLVVQVETADEHAECLIDSQPTGVITSISPDLPLTIAVPDAEVAVKLLSLPPDNSRDFSSRVTFELSQSLLEPPERFMFDAQTTSAANRFLGFIYRRDLIKLLRTRLLGERNGPSPEPRFLMRAIALSRGYDRFAVSEGDGLLCLADLADGSVSLCFLYNRKIVSVAHLTANDLVIDDGKSVHAFGIDLKSLINYQLANCAQHGLSVPLSAMVMCGDLSKLALLETLKPLFSSRVVVPQLRADLITLLASDDSIRFADCLAALGLTVN
jgi:hypothetical protein